MFGSLVLALFAHVSEPGFVAEATGARYGKIIIEGNEETPQHWILKLAGGDMNPGTKIRARDLCEAHERLRKSGYFVVNPWRGIEPRVEFLPNELDPQLMDLRIRVTEKPCNGLRFRVADVVVAGAIDGHTGAIVEAYRLSEYVRYRLTDRK